MPTPIDGVLSQSQRDSLKIVDFIFHIVQSKSDDAEEVIFLDEVQLQQKQKIFFLERLRDFAEGTQYIFKTDSVHLKEKCEQLVSEPDRFVELSRQITSDFAERHGNRMSEGVFVVAVINYLSAPNEWRKLLFLLKMDKKPSFSYSYQEKGGRLVAEVTEISNSLNETKAAIQKSAVIDVTDRFAWDVLAYDRVKKPYLGDYYKAFLGVTERQQDSELTRKAHLAVKQWTRSIPQEDMPTGEDANTFAGRSLNYLKDHDTFDTDEYLNAVVRDENTDRKAALICSLKEQLVEAGVAGQSFRPKPESLPKKNRTQTYKTIEGVTITYEGDNETAGITVQDLGNGRKRIQIETNQLVAKS